MMYWIFSIPLRWDVNVVQATRRQQRPIETVRRIKGRRISPKQVSVNRFRDVVDLAGLAH